MQQIQIGLLIIAAVMWAALVTVFFFVYENSKFKEKRESWDRLLNKAKKKADEINRDARKEAERLGFEAIHNEMRLTARVN